jgi:NAD(P)-dependent dehydrogenase (short-subunit alcohol dehydrogenase family)
VVCVTGASGAIGAEIVRSVLAQGTAMQTPYVTLHSKPHMFYLPRCLYHKQSSQSSTAAAHASLSLALLAGARCSFCDVAPVDALVAELSAKCTPPPLTSTPLLRSKSTRSSRYSDSSIISQVVNVGDEEQVAAWIAATAQAWGRIDGLVNNAAQFIFGKVRDVSCVHTFHIVFIFGGCFKCTLFFI